MEDVGGVLMDDIESTVQLQNYRNDLEGEESMQIDVLGVWSDGGMMGAMGSDYSTYRSYNYEGNR